MRRSFAVPLFLLAALAVGGCARPAAESAFIAADIEVTAAYLALAHPAAMARAADVGDDQLAADLAALGREVHANNVHKAMMLSTAMRDVQTAQDALAATQAVLAAIEARRATTRGGDQ